MDKGPNTIMHNPLRSSIDELYDLYRLDLSRYIASTCGCSPMEVEDIIQNTFARFQAKINLSEIKNPKAFLYKTAYNMAIDAIRHKKVQDDYAAKERDLELNQSNEISPEKIVESRQQLGVIAKALWCMPKKRRQLLLMNRCEQLSYAEIARRIGISETAVRKHVSKALQDCHKALHP